jgi:methylenetetrahydrofolate dehydrogenase (NADP+)/methenyltetrahydrofolate cyclohydrolase
MSAVLLTGQEIADKIKRSVKKDIENLYKKRKKVLKLAALRIGNNSASLIYLRRQKRIAEELGISYCLLALPSNTSQGSVEKEIERLNRDSSVTGIIVCAPVPKQINLQRLFSKIAPEKDAEGLNPANIGRLAYENWSVAPCTANACLSLIDSTGIKLRGKEAVIIGHSAIVGKPLSLMLLSRLATTTVCHIGTYEKGLLEEHVKNAEILVVAVGKSNLIKGNLIRRGAVVIDVGINKHKGKITGDVDFKAAKKRASYITPVPGGVGPVTTIMLMKNLLELYKNKKEIKI